jgi:hypothetical protein
MDEQFQLPVVFIVQLRGQPLQIRLDFGNVRANCAFRMPRTRLIPVNVRRIAYENEHAMSTAGKLLLLRLCQRFSLVAPRGLGLANLHTVARDLDNCPPHDREPFEIGRFSIKWIWRSSRVAAVDDASAPIP